VDNRAKSCTLPHLLDSLNEFAREMLNGYERYMEDGNIKEAKQISSLNENIVLAVGQTLRNTEWWKYQNDIMTEYWISDGDSKAVADSLGLPFSIVCAIISYCRILDLAQ
jgi:hypothetical protein